MNVTLRYASDITMLRLLRLVTFCYGFVTLMLRFTTSGYDWKRNKIFVTLYTPPIPTPSYVYIMKG